ncbi:AraC family transcriptional regulator [Aquimarina sediminis]|uniref:AraC family transcriptional regulator n=1 Tax=Aquimarina sediminis TaxID=2070536 RepID=UPI000CA034F2|nr:AraC family transcriptional regulator [Aquimarina sediminis]
MNIVYEQIHIDQSESLNIRRYTNTLKCATVSWHLHPEYEIVYIKNGQGSIQIDSYYEKYENGILVFLGPNIPHMPFGNDQLKNNIEVVMQFSEDFVTEKLAHFPEFSSILEFIKTSVNGIIFSPETHKELSSLFLKCGKQSKTEELLNFITVLYQLSVAKNQKTVLKNKLSLDVNKHSLERISKVYHYINQHYAQEIRSENLAKQLGLTPNSFCRMFKTATNRNFIDFLNEFRIKKAQEHFDLNNVIISEAMYLSGFNDPSYFSRQFKKYTTVTPSEYIRRLNQTD